MENRVIVVHASGRLLDQLRGEASRVSRANKVDWWMERGDRGTHFCFEDAETKMLSRRSAKTSLFRTWRPRQAIKTGGRRWVMRQKTKALWR